MRFYPQHTSVFEFPRYYPYFCLDNLCYTCEPLENDAPYERLNKIESVFLRDILPNHEDYKLAQTILNQRAINQYGDMMRYSPNIGFIHYI